jgi:hypothetical protein
MKLTHFILLSTYLLAVMNMSLKLSLKERFTNRIVSKCIFIDTNANVTMKILEGKEINGEKTFAYEINQDGKMIKKFRLFDGYVDNNRENEFYLMAVNTGTQKFRPFYFNKITNCDRELLESLEELKKLLSCAGGQSGSYQFKCINLTNKVAPSKLVGMEYTDCLLYEKDEALIIQEKDQPPRIINYTSFKQESLKLTGHDAYTTELVTFTNDSNDSNDMLLVFAGNENCKLKLRQMLNAKFICEIKDNKYIFNFDMQHSTLILPPYLTQTFTQGALEFDFDKKIARISNRTLLKIDAIRFFEKQDKSISISIFSKKNGMKSLNFVNRYRGEICNDLSKKIREFQSKVDNNPYACKEGFYYWHTDITMADPTLIKKENINNLLDYFEGGKHKDYKFDNIILEAPGIYIFKYVHPGKMPIMVLFSFDQDNDEHCFNDIITHMNDPANHPHFQSIADFISCNNAPEITLKLTYFIDDFTIDKASIKTPEDSTIFYYPKNNLIKINNKEFRVIQYQEIENDKILLYVYDGGAKSIIIEIDKNDKANKCLGTIIKMNDKLTCAKNDKKGHSLISYYKKNIKNIKDGEKLMYQ